MVKAQNPVGCIQRWGEIGEWTNPSIPALSPTQAVGKGAEAPAIAGAHPAAESRLAISVSGRL